MARLGTSHQILVFPWRIYDGGQRHLHQTQNLHQIQHHQPPGMCEVSRQICLFHVRYANGSIPNRLVQSAYVMNIPPTSLRRVSANVHTEHPSMPVTICHIWTGFVQYLFLVVSTWPDDLQDLGQEKTRCHPSLTPHLLQGYILYRIRNQGWTSRNSSQENVSYFSWTEAHHALVRTRKITSTKVGPKVLISMFTYSVIVTLVTVREKMLIYLIDYIAMLLFWHWRTLI